MYRFEERCFGHAKQDTCSLLKASIHVKVGSYFPYIINCCTSGVIPRVLGNWGVRFLESIVILHTRQNNFIASLSLKRWLQFRTRYEEMKSEDNMCSVIVLNNSSSTICIPFLIRNCYLAGELYWQAAVMHSSFLQQLLSQRERERERAFLYRQGILLPIDRSHFVDFPLCVLFLQHDIAY